MKIPTIFLFALLLTQSLFSAENRIPAEGYALSSKDGNFHKYEFTRHEIGDNDILIKILYAGVCHSDIHTVRGDWGPVHYPIVPGHEIAGEVVKVGKNVTKFKVGDYAGVGCMVNSCGECDFCKQGLEQFCQHAVYTYASIDSYHNNEVTQGGYSINIVVSEDFGINIPKTADISKVAPLFCAGITTYSPLKFTHVKKGDKIAVAGFGGLGHMALQYAVSMGAEVTVFDITEEKRADAKRLGAVKYVNVNNPEELQGLSNTFSVILSTIPKHYELTMYMQMLKLDGQLVIIGLPAMKDQPTISSGTFVFMARKHVLGSLIGGIPETQEMLNYSVDHNIYPEVKIIPIQELDEAYKNVVDGKVKFRYVIDMSTLD